MIPKTSQRVDALPNIGPKLADALRQVGVPDAETLRSRGSIPVWRQMRARGLFECAMSLQALEGAVQGMRWHDLDRELRAALVALAVDPDNAPEPLTGTAAARPGRGPDVGRTTRTARPGHVDRGGLAVVPDQQAG
ncbi:TfoX/Sxy family DNA transformation protein [Arsenicicoccus dermatophilus]|uniref:TfoX/Sxy family DNA transformation protein n=1 Tax=Arsenicicoccus dermatophilus TaxID=1076331 RepID=UPI0039173115